MLARIIITIICLFASSAAAQGNDLHSSGLVGSVFSSPGCPAVNLNNPCPDRPISADIEVADSAGKVVARAKSDQNGSFEITLAPGDYTVSAQAGLRSPKYEANSSIAVKVLKDSRSKVRLVVDSGIR